MQIKKIEYKRINEKDRLCEITFKNLSINEKPKKIINYFEFGMLYFNKIGKKKINKIKEILKNNIKAKLSNDLINLIISFTLNEYDLEFIIKNNKVLDYKNILIQKPNILENIPSLVIRSENLYEKFNIDKYLIILKNLLKNLYAKISCKKAYLNIRHTGYNNNGNGTAEFIEKSNAIDKSILEEFINYQTNSSGGLSSIYNNNFDKFKYTFSRCDFNFSSKYKGSSYVVERNDNKKEIFLCVGNIFNKNSDFPKLKDVPNLHLHYINHKNNFTVWNEGRALGSTDESVLLCISKPNSEIFYKEDNKISKCIAFLLIPIFLSIIIYFHFFK